MNQIDGDKGWREGCWTGTKKSKNDDDKTMKTVRERHGERTMTEGTKTREAVIEGDR